MALTPRLFLCHALHQGWLVVLQRELQIVVCSGVLCKNFGVEFFAPAVTKHEVSWPFTLQLLALRPG